MPLLVHNVFGLLASIDVACGIVIVGCVCVIGVCIFRILRWKGFI